MIAGLWAALALALASPDEVNPSLYEQALAQDTDAPLWEKQAARAAFLESQALPEQAVPLWRAVLADPDAGIRALRARQRLAFLDARRDADGSLRSWTRLQTARLQFKQTGAAEARDVIVAMLSEEGVGAATSAEARLWLARDALHRLKDAQQAHDLAKPLWVSRDRWDTWVGQRAGIAYAQALARLGRWEEARAVEAGYRVDDHGAPRPTPVDEVARDLSLGFRRQALWATTGLSGLVLGAAALRGGRPRGLPRGLLGLLGAMGIGYGIAHGWQAGTGDAVPWIAAGAAVLHVLSAWALDATTGAARWGIRALAFTGTLAVAWLALDHHQQLEWMGW